jgi:hypothetical protein
MSPSQLHLNLFAERATDGTISCALTGTEIRLEASVGGGLPAMDSGSRRRRLAAGSETRSPAFRRRADLRNRPQASVA